MAMPHSQAPPRPAIERAIADLRAASGPDDEIIVRLPPGGTCSLTWRRATPHELCVFGWQATGELQRLDPRLDAEIRGSRLLADPTRLAYRTGAQGKATQVEVLSYRPGSRIVARLGIEGQPDRYLKLLAKRAYRRAQRRLAGLSTPAGVRLELPCAWLPREHALLFAAAPGDSLHSRLEQGGAVDPRKLARALRSFAEDTDARPLPPRRIEDERASALHQLEQARVLVPPLENLWTQVRAAALDDWSGTAAVHGDLHDKQVFVGCAGVGIIDLEGLQRGDPRLDWVNLLEHLELRARQGLGAAAGLRDALVEALPWDERAPGVRRVHGIVRARLAAVYALRPRWSSLATELAAQAGELLAS